MTLSISLATRRRPGLLFRTVTETLKHISLSDTKLVICADEDDHGTLSMQNQLTDPRIIWSVKPKEASLGTKYNRVMSVAPADVYMVMVDYAPVLTDGFDERVIEASEVYPDGYCFVVGHLANLSFTSINATTHKMAEKMGGIYPEYFPFWFVDHWFEDLARQLGRRVFADVLVDCSKRPGTQEKREPYFWGCLFDWLHLERREIVRSIVESDDFDETPARKKAILRNHPLTEEWSFIINSALQHEDQGVVDANDKDYLELRQKGLELIEREKAKIEMKMGAA